MKEMHFEGFRVRSLSLQELEIAFRASEWSLEDAEMMVRSSANPLTLCGLERLIGVIPVMPFSGWNHLLVPRAGCHFNSVGLVTSVRFPLGNLRQMDPSSSMEVTLARHHPTGSSRVWFIPESIDVRTRYRRCRQTFSSSVHGLAADGRCSRCGSRPPPFFFVPKTLRTAGELKRELQEASPPQSPLLRCRATMQTGQVRQCTAVEDSRHPNEATDTPPSGRERAFEWVNTAGPPPSQLPARTMCKACQRGPEHLRASQTCYCLKLPLASEPVVPLRSQLPFGNGRTS